MLRDAGTTGSDRPDLDFAFVQSRIDGLGEDTIQQVVRGQIAYPVTDPPTDAPGMPADIFEGQDAEDVATYVASVAGPRRERRADRPANPPEPTPPEGGDTDGKSIFASAGCGGCHTLAAAGLERHRRPEPRRREAVEGARGRPDHERPGRDAVLQGPAERGADRGRRDVRHRERRRLRPEADLGEAPPASPRGRRRRASPARRSAAAPARRRPARASASGPGGCVETTISSAGNSRSASSSAWSGSPSPISPRALDARASASRARLASRRACGRARAVLVRRPRPERELSAGQTRSTSSRTPSAFRPRRSRSSSPPTVSFATTRMRRVDAGRRGRRGPAAAAAACRPGSPRAPRRPARGRRRRRARC